MKSLTFGMVGAVSPDDMPSFSRVMCTENILLNGNVVGRVDLVRLSGSTKFHAVIKVGGDEESCDYELIQGWGDSREGAVFESLKKGLLSFERCIEDIKGVQRECGYE